MLILFLLFFFRKYVLYRLKSLKFLDCYEVSANEREKIDKDPLFIDVVKYNEQDEKQFSSSPKYQSNEKSEYTPLPNKKDEITDPNKLPQGKYERANY
jgi:hypothetical protein